MSSYVYQRNGPVSMTRGRADESSQAQPGSVSWEWNNRDGRFSPKNPLSPYYGQLGRNTPVRFSTPAQQNYLRSETDAASGASCPDASGLHITGDLDLRIDLKLSDWQGHDLAYKWVSGTGQSWLLATQPAGTVIFYWSTTGADFPSATSTAPLPLGRLTLRVTLQVSTGTVTFYTGPAGNADASSGWAQLGSAVVTGATSVYASTAAVNIKGWYGAVYELELRSGIGGTVVAHPVFSAQAAGASSFADAQGNTWSVDGTAEISDRNYRFHGQMSSQPPSWDVTGTDMAVKATAAGVLRLIGQGQAPVMSPMKRALLLQSGTLAPVAYWPCEDGGAATMLGSALGGPSMGISGTPQLASDSSFACSAPLPQLNGSVWRGLVPSYTGHGTIVVRFLAKLGALPSSQEPLLRAGIGAGTCSEVYVIAYTGGSLGITGYAADGTVIFASGAVAWGSSGADSQALWYSLEIQPVSGGSVKYSLVTLAPGASAALAWSTTVASNTVGTCTSVTVNPNAFYTDTVAGHISVQSDWESLFNLADPLQAWAGELAAGRFARIAGENGYAVRITGAPAASAPMGAQAVDTLGNLLQACEDADAGLICEPRQCLGLGYRTRASLYNQSPAVTLDYSASQPGGADGNPSDSGLDPTYDDLLTRNDWTLTRTSASAQGGTYQARLDDGSAMSISAPPAGVGDYANTLSVNVADDSQLAQLAWWKVHVGTVDEARWPQIPVNLARTVIQSAGLYYPVLDADIGDLTEVGSPPGLVTYDPVRQLVWGTAEVAGGFRHAVTFNAVPGSPYEVAVAGTAHADTDGSALAAAVSSSATTLLAAATASGTPLWTTNASDFPFDIAVAGERVTVTAIADPSGSATSPAAFTGLVSLALSAGTWIIQWEVTLSGTTGAPEADNFQVSVGATYQVSSVNPAAAGTWVQAPVTVTVPPGGANVWLQSSANAATSGAVYTAAFLSPQKMTVTRAVNGVSKAQSAGAGIALWNTPVAAL